MKAIKLASVFAVTAVAAAVSTATFAAEPVFSGQAGISYTSYDKYSEVNQVGKGELDLTVDTGVVVTSVEFRESNTKLLAAYVKQGAVSFGDFDGSISDDAWTIGDDIVDVKSTPSGAAGIRYAVMPNLTVALEATAADSTANAEKDSDIGVAVKYSQDLGMASVSASAGSVGDYMSYTVGASADVASGVTLAASFGSYTDGSGAKDETRVASGVSVSVAASDALTLTAVYGMFDNEDATGAKYDSSGTYLNVSYKVGDVTYYVENSAGDDFEKFAKSEVKATTIGAKASF
jgi:hypothetical protein